jgi:hypothetical protein
MPAPDEAPTEALYRLTKRLEVLPELTALDGLPGEAGGLMCARCRRATGNDHQGHYWKHCRVTGGYRDFHFCCPGDCELEADEREERSS